MVFTTFWTNAQIQRNLIQLQFHEIHISFRKNPNRFQCAKELLYESKRNHQHCRLEFQFLQELDFHFLFLLRNI